MAAITAQDVAARVGRDLDTSETAQVEAWIADALAHAGQLAGRDLDDAVLPAVVRAVILRAVVRCVYNPAGLRAYTAGSVSYTAGDAASGGDGGPAFTTADAAVIGRAYGRSLGQLRTPPACPPGRTAGRLTDPSPCPVPFASGGAS
ncbi:hypothetical protein [Actinomadura rayongensis]|uniref:Phage gp6-like head-tail connector protein n=1 Tax=Actinomadura rayongensis TaxID=1429076 RepID=A0A6I4WM40_9ACTN|nr:hypothetical protein [Actinomadura rayongensis]MXQ67702.1 hypothetical protein [Actinomadura rayongensis]